MNPQWGFIRFFNRTYILILSTFNPSILKCDVKTPTLGHTSLNCGVCKGMTLDRVLVFPNKPLKIFLLDPSAELKFPEKYFVGVTRAKFSLGFVVETLIPNLYFVEESITLGRIEIRALKFKS